MVVSRWRWRRMRWLMRWSRSCRGADRLPARSCWSWIWIWRPTWAWIRSSRPRCSPRCGNASTWPATTTWRCGSFPTLAHVIGWIRDKTGIAAPTPRGTSRRPVRRAEVPVAVPTGGAVPARGPVVPVPWSVGVMRWSTRCVAIVAEHDRLPAGVAGAGSGSGGRPGRGHGQAGRGVRRGAGTRSTSPATTTWRCASSRRWPT